MSISEQTTRTARNSRPKPKYILRAKVGTGWTNIGAAWPLRSGEDGLSFKITTMPLNWDGRFVALVPLNNEELPEVSEHE